MPREDPVPDLTYAVAILFLSESSLKMEAPDQFLSKTVERAACVEFSIYRPIFAVCDPA
jgi:hypothetical protein